VEIAAAWTIGSERRELNAGADLQAAGPAIEQAVKAFG